MQKLPNNAI